MTEERARTCWCLNCEQWRTAVSQIRALKITAAAIVFMGLIDFFV